MISLHTVLFATDGSASAERARPVAERLAAETSADLHVLRVEIVPRLSRVEFHVVPTLDTVRLTEADVAADLRLPTPAERPRTRTVEAVRQWSHAGEAVLHYAAEVGAGLVVMGTNGRSGLNRLVLGSTAEYVLRRSLCAVLTVGSEADVDARGPVLCPLDFSARSEEAVAVAADIASVRGVSLHILHAVEPVVPSPHGGLVFPPDDVERVERAREEIKRIVAGTALPPVATTVDVHRGYPEYAIFTAALSAGLVVQASHGRRGAARLFLGSVAEAVVREAPCPVLTVKASGVALHRPDADALDRAAPLPRALWAGTLDSLSKKVRDAPPADHGRWTVGVDVVSPDLKPGVLMAHQPFVGASYDAHADRIDVLTEGGSHRIEHPLAVRALDDDGGARLDVVRRDGARERITVRPASAA